MADTPAPQEATTQEQMALRRQARRRLVGAIALALSAVLILPMLFDPEPKPLGPDVDIRIPAQSTPFEATSTPPLAPPAGSLNPPAPQAAEPTQPAPEQPPGDTAAEKAAEEEAAAREAEEKRAAEKLAAEKKAQAAEAKKAQARKPEPKVEEKPLPKPTGAFASHGFYLQLGAFTSEGNARQLQEKVSAAGFKVALNDANGQFRVRVGPIPDREHALEIQARLKARGFKSVMLGP